MLASKTNANDVFSKIKVEQPSGAMALDTLLPQEPTQD